MTYNLPTSVDINGQTYEIRSDYRAALDICIAMSDPELTDEDRVEAALTIFYPDFESIPPDAYQEAIEKCFWFISGGSDEPDSQKSPKLVDWEQDFSLICAPVNRVLGYEIRAAEYIHWWTFLSAYYEIGGDCTFAQVVSIRSKQARGKPLDKNDREWYRRNRNLVDFKKKYSTAENDLLKQWTG